MTRPTPHLLAAGLAALVLPFSAFAAGVAVTNNPPIVRPAKDGYLATVLAHAYPDEYFYGNGSSNNLYVPTGIDPYNCPTIYTPKVVTNKVVVTNETLITTNMVVATNMVPTLSVAKVNQAYVWGMGKSDNDIYFGTLANGDTLVMETYLDETNSSTPSYYEIKEGAKSYYGAQHGGTADWRPPQLWRYNLASHSLTLLATNSAATQANLMTLGGIRAGGMATTNAYNKHQMVLLAGPPIDNSAGGVGFFLFDATSTQFVGTTVNYKYNNIRRMVSVNGDLYFGVQKTNTLNGAVVRWVNNPKTAGYPFIFQEVGTLDEMGADICLHQGRLFCSTWPGYAEGSFEDVTNLLKTISPTELYMRAPGLWMSPVVPAGGLTAAYSTQWQKIWSVANYEPDQVLALTLGGGALASFDGYLYFGTMQVPGTGSTAFQLLYGSPTRPTGPRRPSTNDSSDVWNTYTNNYIIYTNKLAAYNADNAAISANTVRPLSLFRASNFRTPVSYQGVILTLGGDFEVLYGATNLPAFTPSSNGDIYAVANWVSTPNKMGQTPSMGTSGFGDVNNVYTWCMNVFNNTLFVGTWCGTLPSVYADTTYTYGGKKYFYPGFLSAATNPASVYGAQLYCLHSSQASSFRPVSMNGLGNICNYGFRTMSADGNGLYIGTANPRNKLPNPTNSPAYGGWELLKLTRRPSAPYDMDGDFETDAAWMTSTNSTLVIGSASGDTVVTNFSGASGALAAWADYDGDGVADPAWCNPATGVWTVWLSSRNGQKTTPTAFASSGSVPVPADFDGDGKADPALCTTSSGKITWRSTLNSKTCSITPTVSPAGKAFLPAIADYNGDSVSELVWYVPPVSVTVTGRIVRSSSTTVAKLTTQNLTGSFKGVPVPADYDGDGKADFALHNPATGVIRVWPSSGGAFFDSPAPGAGWLPMPGDYYGDGKANFAWYNPTSGIFRIIRHITGETDDTDTVAEFGIPMGSRPVAAPAAVWYTK